MSKLTLLGLVGSSVLIIMGVFAAIFLLPDIDNSLLYFTLFFVPGILIGYMLENTRGPFFWGLGIAGWIYASTWIGMAITLNYYALFIDSLKIVVPIALFGALAFTWIIRKKISFNKVTLKAFFIHALFILLIVVLYAVGGILHYNVRADTSPPQAFTMVVVNKFEAMDIEGGDDWWIEAETLDGQVHLHFNILESYYREQEIGNLFEITGHRGALGYRWFDPPGVK